MKTKSPAAQLAGFLVRYTPAIRSQAKAILARMRNRLPGAVEMVYDNYNALVIGFGPTERPSEAIFSLVIYPRWVTLCFLHGAKLSDPQRQLKGSGKQVRHIVLDDVALIESPEIAKLIDLALEQSSVPIDAAKRRRLIIKSISLTQRPRRPAKS